MEVPETVSQDRIQQRTVEQIVDAPVPQAVEVFRVFSKYMTQQRAVEQTTPATSLLPNVNVLIAMPFQKSGSFIAVAGEFEVFAETYNNPED